MNAFFRTISRSTAVAIGSGLVLTTSGTSSLAQRAAPLPANWQRAGSVWAAPDQAALKTKPGDALLIGTTGQPYVLATTTNDFALTMDLLTTPGADVQITLPSGQPIHLGNVRLSKAPGLWQSVEVRYRATGNRPPMLEKLALNGVTISEGQTLSAQRNGVVSLNALNGSVAVRNVVYKPFAAREVVRWSGPIRYVIYEKENRSRDEAQQQKILKQDTTSQLTYEVAYGGPRHYTILFDGKLNALQGGDYQFDLHQGGIAGLWIDGKPVVPVDYHDLGQPTSVRTNLTAGLHDVQVMFTRSWARPGLGLFVSQDGVRPQALHTLSSLPEPDPVGVISVKANARPELVRSFVQMPGEKTKRTHSLSVGTPDSYHFTLDLNQMTLLQAWKGDFADVTEMWYERGEPQLLRPMGTVVRPPAQPALAILATDAAVWPDSLADTMLQYKGLAVDKAGYPTIDYALAGATITDAVRPGSDGISRTLTVSGSPGGTVYCRVAAGSSIEEISKGLYAVNDRSYYVRIDPKAKAKLRQSNGKQELLLPVSGVVRYEVVF
ncbi:hypothetical protein [Spirosoma montaniterrae]|uniref:PA14 domain-containing protein n=1 Tax=Spirosoma montaniterrae TaxID=1178516 RepID=A0A1P9X0E7_9BACT|nr:hypothetical protein [Spirosoma montaniterrae]AQG81106.1 hypothetical protein AWR27_18325 [Spirosoma montaniterrae]